MLKNPKVLFKGASILFYTKTSKSYVSFRLLLEEEVKKKIIFSFLMTSGRKDEI